MKRRGFTFLELILSVVILAILSAAAIPATRVVVKRQKELELKRTLLEVREAIDRFKKAADENQIDPGDVRQLGYPESLEQLVQGAPLKKDSGQQMRFLRKIPVDPMTGEAEWGLRSSYDDHDANSWGRENLFDIYSLSDGTGLDDTSYSDW